MPCADCLAYVFRGALKGDRAEFWSLTVSGNWRMIFRFAGNDIELVDYLDYH
ncbi:hypothetical protein AvCA_42020 [Azotobacter vinelandii CA]|uniref:Plasmid maintenance system killer protein n=2 Tax=Azotobacter vinelandii TaxID=354 RepID=C1DF00_AZOVD|nr:hypothetical protein Avin_42020 [Azotobacter vinelandii DJ]AGK14419.1 hypothetical protein AvCA_42020 [Azotobacter vinelandii CA]AGK21855.1 hypothetical protein AvCA6_42020 [Azotobacter vinelandii CA6]GLK60240.1 hypothetical protein GCM10017624_24000 [Azotobacter vinelandii]